MTTTTRTYPLVFNWDVESMNHSQIPSSETLRVTQIVNSGSRSDRRWNAIVRGRIGPMLREAYEGVNHTGTATPERQTTVEVAIEPVAVAPGVVAAQVSWYNYPHDMVRGWGALGAFIWSESELRALTAEDLFDPATRWWQALVPKMLEAAYEEPVPEGVEGYEALDRTQTPMIGEKGMCLKFQEDKTSSFVLDQPHFLPWKVLRPYLRRDLPFDPERLEESPSGWEGCDSWRFAT